MTNDQCPMSNKKDLQGIAKKILSLQPNIIAMSGPLGAGKTTLTKEIAKVLGIRENVISPTYVLETEYKIPDSDKLFVHIDCYRMESFDELIRLGIEKRINKNNIVVIEWADKFEIEIRKWILENSGVWVTLGLTEKEDERMVNIL